MPDEKTIGKPDAGNPHVRFERGPQETELQSHRAWGLPPASAEDNPFRHVRVVVADSRVVVTFQQEEIVNERDVDEIGEELLQAQRQAVAAGKPLVLNFEGVRFMSSWMVGRLVLVMKEAKKTGGGLRLCRLHKDVLEVFEITRLINMFDIREGPDDDSPKVGGKA